MGLAEILIILFFVGGLALWIWALVDAVQVREDSMYRSGSKLVWVLVIVLTGFIGAIIYLVAGRPTRERDALGSGQTPEPHLPPPPPAG